jgi:hypothetical protein
MLDYAKTINCLIIGKDKISWKDDIVRVITENHKSVKSWVVVRNALQTFFIDNGVLVKCNTSNLCDEIYKVMADNDE